MPMILPPSTISAWPVSVPSGSTGTIQAASMRRSTVCIGAIVRQKKRGAVCAPSLQPCCCLSTRSFAFDFDFHTAIRCEAGDPLLHVLLVADEAWDRLRLAHAERFDPVAPHTHACEVVANRIGATLGQLLVVLLRADLIGMAGHQHELELLHLVELA